MKAKALAVAATAALALTACGGTSGNMRDPYGYRCDYAQAEPYGYCPDDHNLRQTDVTVTDKDGVTCQFQAVDVKTGLCPR